MDLASGEISWHPHCGHHSVYTDTGDFLGAEDCGEDFARSGGRWMTLVEEVGSTSFPIRTAFGWRCLARILVAAGSLASNISS